MDMVLLFWGSIFTAALILGYSLGLFARQARRSIAVLLMITSALVPVAVILCLAEGTGNSITRAGILLLSPVIFVVGLLAAGFGMKIARRKKVDA